MTDQFKPTRKIAARAGELFSSGQRSISV